MQENGGNLPLTCGNAFVLQTWFSGKRGQRGLPPLVAFLP
jgi:hypothetical protein